MTIIPNTPIKFNIAEKQNQTINIGYKPIQQRKDIVSFSGNVSKIINKEHIPKTIIETIKKSAEEAKCRILSCVKVHRENDLCAGVNLRFRYLSKAKADGTISKILEENPDWSKVIDMMDNADAEFKKLPKSIFKRTFYRGMVSTTDRIDDGIKAIQNAKIGDIVIPDYGYAYATTNKSIGEGYAFVDRPNWEGPRVLMEIIAPRGSQLSRKPTHLNEVVFPRNAKYQIIDKKEENGITKVIMKYVLPKSEN